VNPGTRGKRLLLAACGLSLLALAAWGERLARTGLALQVREADALLIASYDHAGIDAFRINAILALEPRRVRAEWSGFFDVPGAGVDEIVLKSDGVASLRLGQAEIARARSGRVRTRVTPGPKPLSIVYEPAQAALGVSPNREIFVKGVTPDGRSVPLLRSRLFERMPSTREVIVGWLSVVLPAGAALAWGWIFILGVRAGGLADTSRR